MLSDAVQFTDLFPQGEVSSCQPRFDPFSLLYFSFDSLTLCGVNAFHDEELWILFYTHIKHCKIVSCNGLTDRVLGFLPSSLESLEIIDCQHFSDIGIASLHALTHLQELILQDCQNITGASLGSLPSSLSSLKLLHCTNIS